jgi:L-iditol 2-dehydrogenase
MKNPLIPKEMLAAVYRGKNDVRIETVPVPRIRADELLVKVAVCGVCPTDIKKIQAGTLSSPRIFGHETAGTIVKVGTKVAGFRVGDRVGLHHHVPCRKCHFCRHSAYAQCPQFQRTGITAGFEPAGGGFAEYVRVMSFVFPGIVKIPRKADFIHGAMLEPVNTVLKGIARLSLLRGDTVLVAGQGPIGLLFTRALVRAGMRVIATDLIANRRKAAFTTGATWVGTPAELDEVSNPGSRIAGMTRCLPFSPPDAVVVTVPNDAAVTQGHRLIRPSGVVLLFGHTQEGGVISVDPAAVCVREKNLVGSYSSDIRLNAKAARFCFSEIEFLKQLVTCILPLKEAAIAIKRAAGPTLSDLKIAVGTPQVPSAIVRPMIKGLIVQELAKPATKRRIRVESRRRIVKSQTASVDQLPAAKKL